MLLDKEEFIDKESDRIETELKRCKLLIHKPSQGYSIFYIIKYYTT